MESLDASNASAPQLSRDPGQLLRVLGAVGASYIVLAYGLLGFGIILLGGPGLILLALSQSGRSVVLSALGLAGTSLLIVGGVLLAVFWVARRIAQGDLDGARLPALALAIGNLTVAAAGGLLAFDVLTTMGLIGAALYLPTFFLLNGRGTATPGDSG